MAGNETSIAATTGLPGFAEQLTWHLTNGTRPENSTRPSGVAWGTGEFALALGLVDDKNIRNWKGKRVLPSPQLFGAIERELFGLRPQTPTEHFEWRANLRKAYEEETSQRDKLAKARSRTKLTLADQFGPPPRNLQFVGRDEELKSIHVRLNTDSSSDEKIVARVAIHGLGGVGKTSLATEYAYRYRSEYGGIIWCTSDTRTSLLTILSSLGSALGSVPASDRNLEKTARAGLQWLDAQSRPWLLVFDNATNPNVIRDFLPKAHTKILITSRFGDWHSWAASVPLDVLPHEHALQFLQSQSGFENRNDTLELVDALGCLPLALDHAAAYCRQTSTTPSEYALMVDRRLGTVPPGVEYDASFAAVYDLSVSIADSVVSAAPHLLALLSFLAPDRIPRFIVDDGMMPEDIRNEALMALGTSSLIKFGPDNTLSIHPLVRLLTRTKAKQSGTEMEALAIVVRRMAQLIPKLSLYKSEEWPKMRSLIPHTLVLAENSNWTQDSCRDFVNLTIAVGQLLWTYGARGESEMVYRRAIRIGSEILGRDDIDLNDALNDLAIVCSNTDQLVEAQELANEAYQRALAVLGGRHPTVGIRIQVLASIYQKLNNLDEAERVYKTSIDQIDLPPERNENYIWRANLAHCLWQQGKFGEAETYAKDALSRISIIAPLGNEFTGRANIYLALILRDTGRLAESEEKIQVALRILKSTVGDSHLVFGWGLAVLARVLFQQGLFEHALHEVEAAISIFDRNLDRSSIWVKEAINTQILIKKSIEIQ